MNVAAMQSRLRTRFRDPNQQVVTDAEWLDYLNDAYNDVLAASPFWPFHNATNAAVAINAGVRSVDLAATLGADVFRVRSVFNSTDGEPLLPIVGHPLDIYDEASTGTPEKYRVDNQSLEVYPLPDTNKTLRVEYVTQVAALTTGEPVFPERFHRVLIEGALSRAYEDVGNLEMSERHGLRMAGILEQMKNDLLDTQGESYPQINDVWY